MGECCSPPMDHEQFNQNWKIMEPSFHDNRALAWFDLRIFYMRISNLKADKSVPEYLTVNHIPLSADTIFEVDGRRSSSYTDCISSLLRRDRVDKKNEEATYVCTDSIKMTGSSRFDVCDKNDLLLSGVLELSSDNGFTGETEGHCRRWSLSCHPVVTTENCFLKGRQLGGEEWPPVVDVYVTGCFSGAPIILTKTFPLGYSKKHLQILNFIPENESTEIVKGVSSEALQVNAKGYQEHGFGKEVGFFYEDSYMRDGYLEGEDGELSWFNAGLRLGVGIGLGVCLSVGLGVGLLARTYQATSKHLKRRLAK